MKNAKGRLSKIVLSTILLSAPVLALSSTTYHGTPNTFNAGDVLSINKDTAVISNKCVNNGVTSFARVSLHAVKHSNTYVLTGSGSTMIVSRGRMTLKKVPIIMHFKKEPNGNLRLFGTPPSSRALSSFDSSSCELGLSKVEYAGGSKPYSVVFIPDHK